MGLSNFRNKKIYILSSLVALNIAYMQNSNASHYQNFTPPPLADHDPYNQNTLTEVVRAFVRYIGGNQDEQRKIYEVLSNKHIEKNYEEWKRNPSDKREEMSFTKNEIMIGRQVLNIMSHPEQYTINLSSFKDKGTIEITSNSSPIDSKLAFYNTRQEMNGKPKEARNIKIILRLPESSMYYISEHGLDAWKKDPSQLTGAEIVSIHFIP